MPLVIDSSSPAAHAVDMNTTQTNTCAAFTPPADPLLLIAWAGNSASTDPPAPAYASSPAQVWTQDAWDHRATGTPTLDGQAAVAHVAATGTLGSTTVTVTNGEAGASAKSSMLKVYVFTGHDPAAPIGVVHGGRQNSGTSLSDSYTGSIDGGQGFMVITDWAAQAVSGWAAASGCTIVDKGDDTGAANVGISWAVVQRTVADGISGSTTTVGMTGLTTGGQYHWCIVEVISLEAAQAARGIKAGGWTAATSTAANW